MNETGHGYSWPAAMVALSLSVFSSIACAINSIGQTTWARYDGSQISAFVWNGTTVTYLSDLGGTFGFADGLNDAGMVVGRSNIAGDLATHATLWNGNVATDLGTLAGPGGFSEATRINNTGVIVGYSRVSTAPNSLNHAVEWIGGVAKDLGTLAGGDSIANAINDPGQIVGRSSVGGDTHSHATLWQGGSLTDLGTLGGLDSSANDINAAGVIVGSSTRLGSSAMHATIWNGGVLTDLGLGSASGINNVGQIVGLSGATSRAVLWSGGSVIDLNNLLPQSISSQGWVIENPHDINDSGWISGIAVNQLVHPTDGSEFALFLMNSTGDHQTYILTVPQIPEPDTYGLLMAGFGALALAARRRSHQTRLEFISEAPSRPS